MSRFRPGRRQDDPRAAGEFYEGDAYEGDPYDDETYPDGPYPGQAPEPAGPAAQEDSGGTRPAGRPHSSRFRRAAWSAARARTRKRMTRTAAPRRANPGATRRGCTAPAG
jgi:hypothetical protein